MRSTDPTVSLSAMFGQEIGGEARVPIRHVSNLCGLNINPNDAKGVFQKRLNSVMDITEQKQADYQLKAINLQLKESIERAKYRSNVPGWIASDFDAMTASLKEIPSIDAIGSIIRDYLIVEFYSR